MLMVHMFGNHHLKMESQIDFKDILLIHLPLLQKAEKGKHGNSFGDFSY